MIRILIADDHAIVRSGLTQIMTTTDDILVAAQAANGAELLALLDNVRCDLLLLDIGMPALSGIDLIRLLRGKFSSLPILVLSMHSEREIIRQAILAGAAGYVAKTSDVRILLQAIRAVVNGEKFIDPALIDTIILGECANPQEISDRLSPRELEILKMIGSGQALGRIADQLYLSPKTVSAHKMRLMKKLRIDNNADLVRYASRHGLIGV